MQSALSTRFSADWLLWLSAPLLVLTLMFWCQLHGPALGEAPVAIATSMPWALKSAAGWILVALMLRYLGPRWFDQSWARAHSTIASVSLVPMAVAVTLACEMTLGAEAGSLALRLYERLPTHLTFAALLVGGYLLTGASARRKPPAQTLPGVLEVMTGTGHTTIAIQDIECLEADRNYINVHTRDRSYLLRQTLSSLEQSLCPDTFVRIHRSVIVNRAMIREHRRGGIVLLQSGRTVRASRSFAKKWSG